MTGDTNQFFTIKSKEEGFVTFGDNKKGKIIGLGNIKISLSTFIENILLVYDLMHKGFDISFKLSHCMVTSFNNKRIKFIEK